MFSSILSKFNRGTKTELGGRACLCAIFLNITKTLLIAGRYKNKFNDSYLEASYKNSFLATVNVKVSFQQMDI